VVVEAAIRVDVVVVAIEVVVAVAIEDVVVVFEAGVAAVFVAEEEGGLILIIITKAIDLAIEVNMKIPIRD